MTHSPVFSCSCYMSMQISILAIPFPPFINSCELTAHITFCLETSRLKILSNFTTLNFSDPYVLPLILICSRVMEGGRRDSWQWYGSTRQIVNYDPLAGWQMPWPTGFILYNSVVERDDLAPTIVTRIELQRHAGALAFSQSLSKHLMWWEISMIM